MSKPEILEKLDKFLRNTIPFTEECQVVYLLVETRKILDRDENKKYPLLRFYCDWSVHTAKDRISKEMKSIMNMIYSDIKAYIKNPKVDAIEVSGFMYMVSLQQEMGLLLQDYGLPDDLTKNQEIWLQFIALLVQVLADQPINKPCAGINRFQFLPVRQGSVYGLVEFSEPVDGKTHFQYLDTY